MTLKEMKNRTMWKNSTNKNLILEIEKIKIGIGINYKITNQRKNRFSETRKWFEHFKWRKEEMAESFRRAFISKNWSKKIKIGRKFQNLWKFRSLKKWNYRICTYIIMCIISCPLFGMVRSQRL